MKAGSGNETRIGCAYKVGMATMMIAGVATRCLVGVAAMGMATGGLVV